MRLIVVLTSFSFLFCVVFCIFTSVAFSEVPIKLKSDTLDKMQITINTQTLIDLKKENAELKCKITAVQDENDKRTTTILWGIGIIVTLIIVIIAASAFKANQAAKETAKEEFEKEMVKYETDFNSLKESQKKQIEEFQEILNKIQPAESNKG